MNSTEGFIYSEYESDMLGSNCFDQTCNEFVYQETLFGQELSGIYGLYNTHGYITDFSSDSE
jgi:hypothetical protein